MKDGMTGGRVVLGSFVRDSGDRVYKVAMGLCRNPAEAEELIQETFAMAFRKLDQYDVSRPLCPWFFTIMKNVFFNNRRRKWRRHEVSLDTVMACSDEASFAGFLCAMEPDVLDVLVKRETDAIVREALSDLDSRHQEVLMLSSVEELPYKEIAASTGLPIGTVRSRISRGRKYLRRRIRQLDAGLVP